MTTFSSKMSERQTGNSGSTPAASTEIHDSCDDESTVVPTGCPSKRWSLYFVQCDDVHRHVKIGYAADVDARLANLQNGCPYNLILLADVPMISREGAQEAERHLHRRYKQHRVRGEWFRAVDEIMEFVRSLPSRADRIHEAINAGR